MIPWLPRYKILAILRYSWNLRFVFIAGFLSGLEVVQSIWPEGFLAFLPKGVFAALAFFTTNAAFIARLVAQQGIQNAKPSKD